MSDAAPPRWGSAHPSANPEAAHLAVSAERCSKHLMYVVQLCKLYQEQCIIWVWVNTYGYIF